MTSNLTGSWGSKVFVCQEANKPYILDNSSIEDAVVFIKAHEDNTGVIRICGDYGVVDAGFPLAPNETTPALPVRKASSLYVSSTIAGGKVYVIYSGGVNGLQNTILLNILQELKRINKVV